MSAARTPAWRTRAYDKVNSTWPPDLPPLTDVEAVAATRRLYRFGLAFCERRLRGAQLRIAITSGNRHTYVRYGKLFINPSKGWKVLVHGLSHVIHSAAFPNAKPHQFGHAKIEEAMIAEVLSRGWLQGKLRRETKAKVPVDVQLRRYHAILERIARWDRKRRRAETALKKLKMSRRYYERELAARGRLQQERAAA